MNKNRDKIAVIDINNNLTVWELENKKQIHSEMNVNSVSWNSEFNDLLAYSGGGMVFVKCGEFSASFQKMNGEMIAFKAN
jgi:intraflagellar transport protein 122